MVVHSLVKVVHLLVIVVHSLLWNYIANKVTLYAIYQVL